ncbi:hypothetical protein KO505_03785 [Psychrosphaera sp. F3M07]|uniref:DUF6170 family protein n=1 Tax=Psychrosphaera sp. F3M07 TaxID=2841560 RepID=UPI001C0A3143|nr:DUF6170 family protein [Psychrosphaera sp. F3M07]MBU2917083.1 hypothetical protein [Psychrosphaera sp. F3M07]
MFFDTRKITEFAGLNYSQRMLALEIAKGKLTLPKKAVLHTIKLLLIAPVFFLIAGVQSWSVMPWLILLFLLYPIVTKPLTIYFVRGYLAESVEQVKQG